MIRLAGISRGQDSSPALKVFNELSASDRELTTINAALAGRTNDLAAAPVDVDAKQAADAQQQRQSGATDVAEPGTDMTKWTFVQLNDHIMDLKDELARIVRDGGRFGPIYQRISNVTNELNRRIQERERQQQSDKSLDAETRELVQRELGNIAGACLGMAGILSTTFALDETKDNIRNAWGALEGLSTALGSLSQESKDALSPDEKGLGPDLGNEIQATPPDGSPTPMPTGGLPGTTETEEQRMEAPGARATLSEAGQLWMGVGSFGLGGGAVVGMALAGLTLWAAPLAAAGLMSSAYFLGQWGRERSLDRAQGAGVTAWVEGGRVRVTWERFAGLMGLNWMGWLNPIGAWNRDVMALA
ncbi:MAG: hypothetical protein IPL82_09015 [Elusimicrobia bacterium]|nr:hypothetical protein [Elusimicrobiota bacterium]